MNISRDRRSTLYSPEVDLSNNAAEITLTVSGDHLGAKASSNEIHGRPLT